MAAPPRHPPNMEQFEAYFQRADLDRDGRVSGSEAVAFFQGSGLPKNVLAQIWTYSDAKNSGFLGREEFYNALKLVTVAQTGRQLTRDIVMAALGGPAASKIPAPQIKVSATPIPLSSVPSRTQVNAMMPSAQVGSMHASSPQTPGFRGTANQVLPCTGGSQQQNRPDTMRPLHTSLPMQTIGQSLLSGGNMLAPSATISPSVPIQSVTHGFPRGGNIVNPHPPSSMNPNLSTGWFGGPMGGASSDGNTIQIAARGASATVKQDGFGPAYSGPTVPPVAALPVAVVQSASLPPKPPGPVVPSIQPADKDSKALVGNGFSSDSIIGGDAFSATKSKQGGTSSFTPNMVPGTSGVPPITTGFQTPAKPVQSALPPSTAGVTPFSFQTQPSQSSVKQNQHEVIPGTSPSYPPAITGASAASASQLQWPKMTKSNIQKYMKVFLEVDKDRDGKITGEQARNLFLSWRLPREVLKQVWDLSDQDGDSMLSSREFCVALYLMERYREGRPLPHTLPNSIIFDDALLQGTTQPPSSYGGLALQPSSGFPQQGFAGIRPATHPDVLKGQQQTQVPAQVDSQVQPVQKKSSVPVLEKYLVDQLSNEEQSALDSKLKEATDADKKVQELEKEIMDAKEKIEFYRAKMQELVLYKSRCDTRLLEVIEKASGNKREYEVLAKKYEEKCKQVGDVASKLTIEEATFREIQERKMKLYNAIVKLDAGSADESLKAKAEQVQSDLEGLVKSLNDRCKQYGLRAKPTTLVELPFGWQPGVQEGAADWDEDWDKFEEEGFQLVKEFTVDVQNIIAAPKSKALSVSKETDTKDEPLPAISLEDGKVEKDSISNELEAKSEATAVQSEHNLDRSLPGSPSGKGSTAPGSPAAKVTTPSSPLGNVDLPSPKFDSSSFRMDDLSPHANDLHSEQEGIDSIMQQEGIDSSMHDHKDAGEISWGPTFDTHEDAEPIWNFSSDNKFQLPGHGNSADDALFGTGDFGLNPIKTGPSTSYDFGRDSSSFFADSIVGTPPANDFAREKNSFFADSVPASPFYNSVFSPRFNDGPGMGSPGTANDFGKKSSFFADSVPGTPHFNSVFSPRFGDGTDKSFDNFERFDSFSTQGNLSRFDSFNAQGNLSRFDSFNAQPGLSRFDSMRSTAASDVGGFFTQNESFTRFDSMSGTRDTNHSRSFASFDDSDPFGSGPFKPLDNSTPKHSSNQWSAF